MTRTALLALLALAAPALALAGPEGRWRTASGNLEVEIAPCGRALCGTVVKVLANHSMDDPGRALADEVPGLGLVVLSNFLPAEGGGWEGFIYNRENRSTYACALSQPSDDALELHGYVGWKWFGRSQTWTRVEAAGPAR